MTKYLSFEINIIAVLLDYNIDIKWNSKTKKHCKIPSDPKFPPVFLLNLDLIFKRVDMQRETFAYFITMVTSYIYTDVHVKHKGS